MERTYDELLARIDYMKFEVGDSGINEESTAIQALRAVVELHKPRTESNYCAKCRNAGGKLVPYPCPTIQAIEEKLNNA